MMTTHDDCFEEIEDELVFGDVGSKAKSPGQIITLLTLQMPNI